MNTDKPKDFAETLAKIVGIVFHPLLMPVYGMAIIFSAPTLYGYLPFNVKKLLLLINHDYPLCYYLVYCVQIPYSSVF